MQKTKQQLKEDYGVPMPENFDSEQDYVNAKTLWQQENPAQYDEIINAPVEIGE